MTVLPTPLSASRWAPLPPPASSCNTRPDTPAQLRRLLARLAHKATLLRLSLRLSLSAAADADASSSSPRPAHPTAYQHQQQHRQFTLDFFEFYTLLERALLLLLSLSRTPAPAPTPAPTPTPTPTRHTSHWQRPVAAATAPRRRVALSMIVRSAGADTVAHAPPPRHRFHESVLEAFEAEECALRGCLGGGAARRWLRTAKAWRNRWKEGVEGEDSRSKEGKEEVFGLDLEEGVEEVLERMLETIGVGLAEAERVVVGSLEGAAEEGTGGSEGDWRMEVDEGEWDGGGDAMEWEEFET